MSGQTRAEIRIDAPRDFVFDRTNDLDSWTEMFTEYDRVEVLERGPSHFVFRLTTKPDEDGDVHTWISRRDLFKDDWRIEARRLEPLVPFSSMEIRWWYDEVDGGTLMRWQQEFTVADGMPFSEADAEAHISAGSEEQMQAIKRWVEEQWASR